MSVNSRLKPFRSFTSFYRQILPKSSCVKKETAHVDILLTFRNGDRKIMQSIRITSRPQEKGSGTSRASSEEHLPK